MRRYHKSFTTVDLLSGLAAMVLLLALAGPALSRARELSRRAVCAMNLSGIGATAKIYAASNNGQWMVPPFRRAAIDSYGIEYLAFAYAPGGHGVVGAFRQFPSEWDDGSAYGSTGMSVTRAMWMLVRSGDTSVKQFICPSRIDDYPDSTAQLDLYYDFTRYENISYGYQVPFGPPDTQAREGADPRLVFAADKGPYYGGGYEVDWAHLGSDGGPLALDDPPRYWRPLNSANHGGQASADGQNVLFADGHTAFATPAIGVDNDNIYRFMMDDWASFPNNVIFGDSPYWRRRNYPGYNVYGTGPGTYSSTDSVIFP